MKLTVEHKYLWFPVKTDAPKTTIEIFQSGNKKFEFNIESSETDYDFYSYLNIANLIGSDIEIKGNAQNAWISQIRNEDHLPQKSNHRLRYCNAKRPKIHFTADIGWINDPNGLVYHDGVYHLFFQHNPFGVKWDNMSWGHAVSKDLLHWTQKDEALYPDAQGTMFSGCAFVDENNLLQAGKEALLFYYTAAGRNNNWSKEVDFTQRLAISTDEGETLEKFDSFAIEHIAGENRDPKVFYHKQSERYVMVLFLDGYDFAIFNSTDLLHWTRTQTLTLEKAWECPDLFELSVDGDSSNSHWVFWSADGFYFIGDFDGATFTLKSDRLCAYTTKIPYAAQTYTGITDRVISQSWLRCTNHLSTHTGVMAIPIALGLTNSCDGLRLTMTPIEEINTLREGQYHMKNLFRTPEIRLQDQAAEMLLSFSPQMQGNVSIELSGESLLVDFDLGTLKLRHDVAHFDHHNALNLRIFVDYEVIEIFGNNGTVYMVCENCINSLNGILQVISPKEIPSVDIYTLRC